MAKARRTPVVDLAELLGSWELHLRAERKSAETLKSYGNGVRAYLTWCERAGRSAVVDRHQLREFVAALLGEGAKPATAVSRHLAVRRFSAWLTEEGEQGLDPLLGLRAPKLDKPAVEPLTDDQLGHAQGLPWADLRDERDEAVLRLMFTAGARAGEVVALQVTDLSLRGDPATATIRRGKGGTGRVVPLAPEVASAVDRYLRARKAHRLAASPRCGWRTGARGSPTTPCTRLWRCAPAGRRGRVPPAHASSYGCSPLARRRRFGGRPDGRRRLDPSRHAAALHAGPGLSPSRGRAQRLNLGQL